MARILMLLSLTAVAFAEGATGTAPADGGAPAGLGGDPAQQEPGAGGSMIFLIFFVVIGFMLWSSFRQSKKEKQKQQALISGLKLGDKVESIGGLRGTVARIGEGEVDIKTGDETVITMAAGAVKTVNADEKPGDKDSK